MLKTVHEVLNASAASELNQIVFLAAFFSFLLMPYGAMAFTERADRSTELLDRIYDVVAIAVTLGIVGVGASAGSEGLVAVGVGVAMTVMVFVVLLAGLLLLMFTFTLASRAQPVVRPTERD